MAKNTVKKNSKESVWSKKLSGTQIFALAIVVIMVGSTIAFALLSNSDNGSSNPNGSTAPLSNTEGTPLTYTAVVPAKVKSLLPSFTLVAQTSEVDIQKIDALVSAVSGIRQLSSRVQMQGQGFVYYAEISFDGKKTTFEALTSALTEKTAGVLGSFSFVKNGFVEIPKTVNLANQDLNVSRDYTFDTQLVPAKLDFLTLTNDSLQVQLQVSLTGSNLQSVQAFEIQNSNENTKSVSRLASVDLAVAELAPNLGLIIQADYLPDSNQDANAAFWEEKLSTVPGIQLFPVSVRPDSHLRFSVNAQLDVPAFLAFLATINPTNPVQAYTNQLPYQATIDVHSNKAEWLSYREKVLDYLQSVSVALDKAVFLPGVQIQGALKLNSDLPLVSKQTADQLKAALWHDAQTVTVFQQATFNATELSDSNAVFSVPGGTIDGRVVPGTDVNNSVHVVVQFTTRRTAVTDAVAIQTELDSVLSPNQ
ncbi:MAG: hypothetical protein V1777_02905 [Candidatus Micrarchaeota archaeon]